MAMKMKIGVFGGSFDPPHLGHLYLAENARQMLKLDRVLFVPSGNPYHKHFSVASAADRFKLTELAINNDHHFQASRIDMQRHGPTYSVDTAKELKSIYGREAQLIFLIGADNIKKIPKWKNYKTFLRLVKVVAVPRPGTPTKGLAIINNHIINMLDCRTLNISSKNVRNELKNGIRTAAQYKLPPRVWSYIERKELYV